MGLYPWGGGGGLKSGILRYLLIVLTSCDTCKYKQNRGSARRFNNVTILGCFGCCYHKNFRQILEHCISLFIFQYISFLANELVIYLFINQIINYLIC